MSSSKNYFHLPSSTIILCFIQNDFQFPGVFPRPAVAYENFPWSHFWSSPEISRLPSRPWWRPNLPRPAWDFFLPNKFAWKLPLSVGIFDYLIGVFQTWLYILIRIFCLEKSVEGITTNPMAHVNLGAPSDFCSAHFQPAPLKGPNFHPPRFGRKKVRLKLATGFFCR